MASVKPILRFEMALEGELKDSEAIPLSTSEQILAKELIDTGKAFDLSNVASTFVQRMPVLCVLRRGTKGPGKRLLKTTNMPPLGGSGVSELHIFINF